MGIFKGNHAGYSHRNASRSILCGGDRPADNSEVVYDSGSLYEAIRPLSPFPHFSPQRNGEMLLIDGGVLNPLPLNRVTRSDGDLLRVRQCERTQRYAAPNTSGKPANGTDIGQPAACAGRLPG